MRHHKISSQHRSQAKEDKDGQIAQSSVAVWILPQGIVHGSPDGSHTQQEQQCRFPGEESTERSPYHNGSEHTAQDHKKHYQYLEIFHTNLTFGQAVHGSLALFAVGTAEEIAQFVGQV